MVVTYSKNDLSETWGSKIIRLLSFNTFRTYILKSNDGRRIFVDTDLGLIFDSDTKEKVKIKELEDAISEVSD